MLSLMAADAVRDPEGLCSARFRADILTTDVDYESLRAGDVVHVDGRALTITRVGKSCHPECALVRQGKLCGLKNNCAFAEMHKKDGQEPHDRSIRS